MGKQWAGPVAGQEDIWLLLEQGGLRHLVVEAAVRGVEVLVGEQVNVDAALGFIHFSNLRSVEVCGEEK